MQDDKIFDFQLILANAYLREMIRSQALNILFLLFFSALFAQDEDPKGAFLQFWEKNDAEFRNPETSPLEEPAIADFDSIPRYRYNPEYRVKAQVKVFKRQKPFRFETTGSIKHDYQKVAELTFMLDSTELTLSAYRNLSLMRNPELRNLLFIPFTDASNGFGTYEGGRYLEIDGIPEEEVYLDFNLAYNPYCLYNKKYSCPIPPRENDLEVPIYAGAKSD